MAKSKSNNLMLVVSIFLILLILGSIGLVIYYFTSTPQIIIQTGTYTCPSGKYCSVTPILKCTTPISDTRVIFRTNAIAESNFFDKDGAVWIAVDKYDRGVLTKYKAISVTTTPCTNSNPILNGGVIVKTNYYNTVSSVGAGTRGEERVGICSGTTMYKFEETDLVNPDETSLSPTSPYKDRTPKQEVYSGNLYDCSKQLLKNGNSLGNLSHSGTSPTPSDGKIGSTYSLTGGDIFSSSGTGAISLDVTSSTIPITTCTSSNGTILQVGQTICKDQYVLEKCEVAGSATTRQNAIPPEICRNGAIIQAYNVDITLNKLVLSRTENLVVDFHLKDTEFNKNIQVSAEIYKGNTFIVEKIQGTGNNYLTAGKTKFTFDTLPVGYYTLKVSFSHVDGDYSKEINFQVTEDLTVILTTANPIQFDSKDIEASLQSFRSGSPKTLTNFELEAKFNGNTVNQYTHSFPSLGIISFEFPINGDGILRLRARGNDESGLWTDWTDYFEITVKKSTILFSTDFKTDECTGSITQKFETRDTSGNLVDTQNTVTIDKPLGGTDSASVSGSGGKYQFSYNFASGGLYIVRITSTNPQLGSSQLNAGQGQTVNILSGEACSGGGSGCEGISCYTTYIIIGVAIVVIGLFIYLVFFFRRK